MSSPNAVFRKHQRSDRCVAGNVVATCIWSRSPTTSAECCTATRCRISIPADRRVTASKLSLRNLVSGTTPICISSQQADLPSSLTLRGVGNSTRSKDGENVFERNPGTLNRGFELRLSESAWTDFCATPLTPRSAGNVLLPRSQILICYPSSLATATKGNTQRAATQEYG
jgi:hypothetical protein